jgi:S-DNA-T family DNA segregation ATPase FtsK/SpoIIIE
MMTQAITELNGILQSFKIKASCVDYNRSDNYFYYDLKLNPAGKVTDISKYSNEISLALKTAAKPTVKILHQEGVIRLEFVSPREKPLNLFDYFTNDNIPNGAINCLIGQTVDGQPMWIDLEQNPHMIIAGTTGSGKSTLLHNIIANLFNYSDVDLFLVDPKQIEFSEYAKNISKCTVLNSFAETMDLLNSMLELMEFRYSLISAGFAISSLKPVVIIIDEFADLSMQDRDDVFFTSLCRLAQKCRAARIHIILSTQRPSVNVINGAIKANFPARIACRVASHIDSKVILDTKGAESLLGKGDALLRDNFRFMDRFQVAYTNAKEVCKYFGDKNDNN